MTGQATDGNHRLAGPLRACLPPGLLEAFEHAPVMVTVTEGPDLRLVWRNRAAMDAYGPAPIGKPLLETFPASSEARHLWERAFAGETVTQDLHLVEVPDRSGRTRVARYSLSPLRDPGGTVAGVIQFVSDATAEVDAQRQAALARVLATIAEAASGASDAQEALDALARALVPALADMAAVYAYPDGTDPIPPVAVAMTAELQGIGPLPAPTRREIPAPWRDSLAAGRALVVPVDADTIADLAPSPEARAWLKAARASSLALVPLVVAGRLAGGLVLVSSHPRPSYQAPDLEFVREVTNVAGACIAEVGARQQDRRSAMRLQQALLPDRPAPIPGLSLSVRYVPGGEEGAAGGDWWDVLDMGSGRIGIGIGDISGHGIGAAALMGQARVAMRTAGHLLGSPAAVLSEVDARLMEAVDRQWGDDDLHRFATALYAVADLGSGTIRAASAGHLPVLLKRASGRVELLWPPAGPPLALGLVGYQERQALFEPGDMAVLYTDGLVEDRSCPVDEGVRCLSEQLERIPSGTGVEAVADRLLAGMGRFGRGPDDVALVVCARL